MRGIFIIFLLILPLLSSAQRRQQRFELVFAGGVAVYNGDLGGNQTKFTSDYLQKLGGSCGVGLRVHLSNHLAVRTNLNYCMVSGADSLSNDKFRKGRNLSFRSPIYEGNLIFELSLVNWKHISGQNVKSSRSGRANLYAFLGMGFFKFDPQAYYDGKWRRLQPLGTEGQGAKPGFERYSLTSSSLIFGLGYRVLLGGRYSLGIEAGARKTNTDYLDDVSGKYYDNAEIARYNESIAAALADRSIGQDGPWPSGSGRGNPAVKDYYMTLNLTLSVKLGRGAGNNSRGGNFRTRNRCFQF